MSQGSKTSAMTGKPLPQADSREALQWFVNNFGLYIGSARGLFLSEWSYEQQASLEATIVNLKSRGFSPVVVSWEELKRQSEYLFRESRQRTNFGKPFVTQLELDLNVAEILIIEGLEAPESSRQLWYFLNQVFYPRSLAGKVTLITCPLSYEEFLRYGTATTEPDFLGKPINWEKLRWAMESVLIELEHFKKMKEEGLPPMLKAEYLFYQALCERGLAPIPQHVVNDYLLDFALVESDHRLDLECEGLAALGSNELEKQEARRNAVLLSEGWQILKFSTSEIVTNIKACAQAVEEVWQAKDKKSHVGRLFTNKTPKSIPDLPVEDKTQVAAITHGGGPLVIAGGAGVGKTTCLAQRTAYLLAQDADPENILIITYSADTLRTLKASIEQSCTPEISRRLNLFSWQDLGLKILKENLSAIKRKPPLKIEPNPQKIIQRLLARYKKEVDPLKFELSANLDEFYIASVISMYKAHLVSPKQAKDDAKGEIEKVIAKIYQAFEDQLQKSNRISRDDVVLLAVQVLVTYSEIRDRYQHQYEHVLVDEYQDATVAEDMLARILAAPQDNFLMAGDEDETITEASGNACPELFTEISFRLPQAQCYVLETNWRSHPAIVEPASKLLQGLNRKKINKKLRSAWGSATGSAIIGPQQLDDEWQEANWVGNEIQILIDSGRNLADIAVLCRHHALGTPIAEALEKRGIHYLAPHPDLVLVPDEVEDMLAFLKLVMDPDGPRARESFERICQLRIKEIDPKLSATIASFAEANNLSYLKAVEIYSEATADQSCRELEQVVRIIRTMNLENLPPSETISLIRRTQRLNDYYRFVRVPHGCRYEPLKKLAELEDKSRNFKTVAELVKHLSYEREQQSGNVISEPGVCIQTIHDSKGAEFPVVFVVGLAEGIFPAETAVDLEEERRICYVAFSRARELLYVSYPATFGQVKVQPSRFIIDAGLLLASGQKPSLTSAAAAVNRSPALAELAKVAAPEKKLENEPLQAVPQIIAKIEHQTQELMLESKTQEKTPAKTQEKTQENVPENVQEKVQEHERQIKEQEQTKEVIPEQVLKTPPQELQTGIATGENDNPATTPATRMIPEIALASQSLQKKQPEPSSVQEKPEQQEQQKSQTLCSTCNFELEGNARFCGNCGNAVPALASQSNSCKACNTELEAEAKFCGACGMPVSGTLPHEPGLVGNLRKLEQLKEKHSSWMINLLKRLEQ